MHEASGTFRGLRMSNDALRRELRQRERTRDMGWSIAGLVVLAANELAPVAPLLSCFAIVTLGGGIAKILGLI